jgi:hypothetical protein
MRLGWNEIEILKALAREESPTVSSSQRLRLELMGLVIDSAKGLMLTPAGRHESRTAKPTEHERFEMPERPLDAAGRKRMLDRVVPTT